MDYFCRICGRIRPEEFFNRWGRDANVCTKCQQMPRGKRERIECLDELYRFLDCSRISTMARLEQLGRHADADVRALAGLVHEIAQIRPSRKRRVQIIAERDPVLFARMAGLLSDEWWDEFWLDHSQPEHEPLRVQWKWARRNDHGLLSQGAVLPGSLVNGSSSAAHHGASEHTKPPERMPPALLSASSPLVHSRAKPHGSAALKSVIIHTDGACVGNPGPGGWAALLRFGQHRREISGAEPATTNNRMEMLAAIAALETLKEPCAVSINTDSAYLRDGITKWLARWKLNGWRTRDRTPVKNEDLWRRLEAATAGHRVSWHWIKGHAGHPENERCDTLARNAIKGLH